MTTGADCDTIRKRPSERRAVSYTREGRPAALGFSLDVDAMRVEIAPLDVSQPGSPGLPELTAVAPAGVLPHRS